MRVKTKPSAPDTPADGTAPAEPRGRQRVGLGRLLREADIAFAQEFRAHLDGHDVTVAQYQHLRFLWDGDGITQGELSRILRVKDASSTATLNSLERKGLIRRERDPGDRRKVSLYVTPRGAALKDELMFCARLANRKALAVLSDDEADALFDLLRRVVEALKAPG